MPRSRPRRRRVIMACLAEPAPRPRKGPRAWPAARTSWRETARSGNRAGRLSTILPVEALSFVAGCAISNRSESRFQGKERTMKMTRMLRMSMSFAFGAAMVLTLLAGSSAFAVEPVHKGVDMWMTVSGMARTSFAKEPIPAGFFCEGSQPFTGTVTFKGAPLATEPARALGDIDTVVRRLDDAVFDEKGQATTRIQLMALSLISTAPIETSCGKYNVAVHLDGEQPTTTMRILRTSALGGSYSAPLALNVKAVFTPFTGDPSARRELTTHIDLGPSTNSVWMYLNAPQYKGAVKIDTHGTGRADTLLPAASNFIPGVTPA